MLANCTRCFRVHNKRFNPQLCEACHGQHLTRGVRQQETAMTQLYQSQSRPNALEGTGPRPRDRFDRPWRQAN